MRDKFRYIKGDLSSHEKEELNDDYNLDVYDDNAFAVAVITKGEFDLILEYDKPKAGKQYK